MAPEPPTLVVCSDKGTRKGSVEVGGMLGDNLVLGARVSCVAFWRSSGSMLVPRLLGSCSEHGARDVDRF